MIAMDKVHSIRQLFYEQGKSVVQTKMRTSKFTTSDLQKLLEHIRTMEEDNGE